MLYVFYQSEIVHMVFSIIYLFSASVHMLRHMAFGNLSAKDFNGTIKNCISRHGSSKG